MEYERSFYYFCEQMERWAKIWFQGADADGLSSIDPVLYKERYDYISCCSPVWFNFCIDTYFLTLLQFVAFDLQIYAPYGRIAGH